MHFGGCACIILGKCMGSNYHINEQVVHDWPLNFTYMYCGQINNHSMDNFEVYVISVHDIITKGLPAAMAHWTAWARRYSAW